jgi:hypothetical protein
MNAEIKSDFSISGEHPQKVAWRLIFNQHLEHAKNTHGATTIESACKAAIITARYCLAVADRYNQLEKLFWEQVIRYINTVYEQKKNQGEIDKSRDAVGV